MANKSDSWRHHAFPFGLQKYWKSGGKIRWLDGDGQPKEKTFHRKATGWNKNGHTVIYTDQWGNEQNVWPNHNFEDDFNIDDKVHQIVDPLLELCPRKNSSADFSKIARALERPRMTSLKVGQSQPLAVNKHRDLLEFMLSLVDRSLYFRRRMESFSWQKNQTSKTPVGTSNIFRAFSEDRRIARHGPLENHHFLAIHDPKGRFFYPDGLPNWIVMKANGDRIWGRLLVPLTPELLIYFSTPDQIHERNRLTSITAPRKLQIQLNQILMYHSEKQTYFKGTAPNERLYNPHNELNSLDPNDEPAIRVLDRISGYNEPRTRLALDQKLWAHCKETGNIYGGEITNPYGFRIS